jgi:hypothetical protein
LTGNPLKDRSWPEEYAIDAEKNMIGEREDHDNRLVLNHPYVPFPINKCGKEKKRFLRGAPLLSFEIATVLIIPIFVKKFRNPPSCLKDWTGRQRPFRERPGVLIPLSLLEKLFHVDATPGLAERLMGAHHR